MSSKEKQAKAGIPQKRRGQETGAGGRRAKMVEAKENTASTRGRRKFANKMFADKSDQQVGTDAAKPMSNSPSLPAAIPVGRKYGESGGEREFKERQARKTKAKK